MYLIPFVDKNLPRRKVLATLPGAVTILPGCVFPPESGRQRNLSMDLLNVSTESNQYAIKMNPQVGVTGTLEPFRNVSFIVKDDRGNVICRESIGDLDRTSDYEPITISCTEFPHTISYEIEGDPCADDTSVKKMVYDSSEEDWVPSFIDC